MNKLRKKMRNKIVCVFVVALLIATVFPVVHGLDGTKVRGLDCSDSGNIDTIVLGNNNDTLDQQQNSNCGMGWDLKEGQYYAQGFKPSLKNLTRVEIRLFRAGSPPAGTKIKLSIRSSLEEHDLTDVTIDTDQIQITSYGNWIEFDFLNITITPGETYYIVCGASSGTHLNSYCWLYDRNNPYENGEAWSKPSSSSPWELVDYPPDEPQCDFCFKTYGTRGTEDNHPPFVPTITGPSKGKINEQQYYTFYTMDPDGDGIYYWVEWGDGSKEEWIGPVGSDDQEILSHTWNAEGTYTIRAKAKDTYDVESDWATLEVKMPKNKDVHPLFQRFLELLRERFPRFISS